MSDKKTFFESLEPKSALIVGVVAGFLVLGTIGFLVTLGILLGGKGGATDDNLAVNTNTPVVNANQQTLVTPTVPKTNKPKVELFVMSYCPYGLQMEKAYLPAWSLLKDKADISLKFVSYAMHDLKEVEENTRQYCIGKEQGDKLISYLSCFSGKDDSAGCLKEAKINESKMSSCVTKANKDFGIMDKYNDQASWLSGRYPIYPVHQAENDQYGVQGSPTLVINGQEASVSRTPEAVKLAICAGFENAPKECETVLSNASPQPGFGAGTTAATTDPAACGT